MYLSGRGVPQSVEEAVQWHRKVAEQGYANVQVNLGLMYDDGRGMTLFDGGALKWYEEKAEHEMLMPKITLDGCITLDLVFFNQMKKLSSGTEKALTKETQMPNITLDRCIRMGWVCLNLMKKQRNGTGKPQNKGLLMRNITFD
uniref:Sel1 repeat family protein n=1 Tax=Plectus sambesii TaxID=2011161 RepID=A0A914UR81_9BILA